MLDPEAFGTVAAICRYATRRTSSHARRTLSSAARRTRAEAAAARSGVDPHRIGGGSKRNASLSRRHRNHTASARLRARVLCSLTFELLGSRQLGSGSPAAAWAKDSGATVCSGGPGPPADRARPPRGRSWLGAPCGVSGRRVACLVVGRRAVARRRGASGGWGRDRRAASGARAPTRDRRERERSTVRS